MLSIWTGDAPKKPVIYLNRTYVLLYNKVVNGLLPETVKCQYVSIDGVHNQLNPHTLLRSANMMVRSNRLYHDGEQWQHSCQYVVNRKYSLFC